MKYQAELDITLDTLGKPSLELEYPILKGPKGDKGDKGDSYTITEADYAAIAAKVDVPTDTYINSLIDAKLTALGRAEDGEY